MITISVVAHKQRSDLERLLPSLLRAAEKAQAEICIVDNRSDDGTRELLAGYAGRVCVTYNPDRAGYGQNHNLNLRQARGEYFVIMNADMVVEEDTFTALAAFMDAHPDVGMASPRFVGEDGVVQGSNKRLPAVWDLFLRRFMPAPFRKHFQRRLDAYEMRDVGYEQTCDVPFLSGAFLFCRTEVLQSVGGFDEKFFLYFEDVDLCRRVARTHRTVYFPGATVTHFWKRAAHKDRRFAWYFISSAARYFRKWGWRLA